MAPATAKLHHPQVKGRHGADPLRGHLAMAYLNRIGPPLEGLITSLTGLSVEVSSFGPLISIVFH
jgi:hypothetical protein